MKQGSKLNSLAPLKIKITLEGGTMLEYKIVTKSQFTIIGRSRKFNTETSCGEIPAGTWAVFPCKGALQKSLQDVNTQIWSEWLPSCKSYKLAGNYNIEMYTPPCEKPEDNYSEIWIPVENI